MELMSIQLAFGVKTGPGVSCWLPAPGGRAVPAADRAGAHAPGAAVAVGPDDPDAARAAVGRLALLTGTAAGAGVDLGGGFTSARLAGAQGDRRDAVLAALRILGGEGAHRLGDRTATLVALFGPAATKRVGAAANAAVAEERWGAVHLASAASDLLGPEQLERVLDLRAPEGIDPFPRGAASTLAGHLARVLAGYRPPRRLALVVSLWDHVCDELLDRQRRERRAASQTSAHRIPGLESRYQEHFDEPLLAQLRQSEGLEPSFAAAARWRPPIWWTAREFTRLVHDAIAATALLRFARTLSDEGLAAAAAKHREELVAADFLTKNERGKAARRPDGAINHPARPGNYVHELVERLSPERMVNPKTEAQVRARAAMARNYGEVVLAAARCALVDNFEEPLHNCHDTCRPWEVPQLQKWRAATGFSRTPESWEQPPLADAHPGAPTEPLARRLAEDPAAGETPHDLLWFGDLADALAPFHGNERAEIRPARPVPNAWYDQSPPARARSVPLAAAGAAQLVMLGATPPPRCGSWRELVAGLEADTAITTAGTGAFPIPAEVVAMAEQSVAGCSVELGRDPRQLAEWSGYMGNCIGESWYADRAHKGHCVLVAFRNPADGRIVANLDIRRHTGGWYVHELRARFNDDVSRPLDKQIRAWVDGIPAPLPPAPEPLLPVPPVRARGGSRRSAAGRLPAELVKALTTAVERELASSATASARRTYATLARSLGRHADFDPEAAVIALNRTDSLAEVLRTALDDGLGALAIWRATRVRPLASAVARLDPDLREHDRLSTLTAGAALPRTLRALVRRPEIAPAHAMDVVARALCTAMGTLATDALARSVARRPSPELVCALAIATTCRSTSDQTVQVAERGKVSVPGFPASDLSDEHGPWQRAFPAAAELGAPVDVFWEGVADHGLLVPAALLGKGGWQALWSRAHR